MLEEALEGLAPESGDGHVRELAEMVRGLMEGGKEGIVGERKEFGAHAVENEKGRVRSGEGGQAVEETETI